MLNSYKMAAYNRPVDNKSESLKYSGNSKQL
jgi:hypothetical protein